MTSQIKTMLLLALLSGIIIVLGGMIGGRTGVIMAFALALVMNVGSYWYSDKIVLSMYHARELAPDESPFLFDIVRRLSTNAGIPMPRICVIPEEAPNAFATGRDPQHAVVAVTDGIMHLLSPQELEGDGHLNKSGCQGSEKGKDNGSKTATTIFTVPVTKNCGKLKNICKGNDCGSHYSRYRLNQYITIDYVADFMGHNTHRVHGNTWLMKPVRACATSLSLLPERCTNLARPAAGFLSIPVTPARRKCLL